MAVSPVADQFSKLSKEKQMDVFFEIQEILIANELNKLPEEIVAEIEKREKEIVAGKVEAIPYDVAISELRNAV